MADHSRVPNTKGTLINFQKKFSPLGPYLDPRLSNFKKFSNLILRKVIFSKDCFTIFVTLIIDKSAK